MKDYRGLPVARITYSPGEHELAAQTFYLPRIAAIARRCRRGHGHRHRRRGVGPLSVAASDLPDTAHVFGGMTMGTDPATSVTDGTARMHSVPNVVVADGSVFPTSRRSQPDPHDHGHRVAQRARVGEVSAR